MAVDLSRLSPGERQVLTLLAQGHTAKSIAIDTGMSVSAVNDRLREARAKTGVGSSRELARMLRDADPSQEIGVEKIGVPSSSVAMTGRGTGSAPDRPVRSKEYLIMSLAVLIVAGAALTLANHQPASNASPPRIVATNPANGATIAAGPFVLGVTFDRPMAAGRHSYTGDPRLLPSCDFPAALSADDRTFTVRCRADSKRRYVVGFNGGSFRNFVSKEGAVPAATGEVHFSVR